MAVFIAALVMAAPASAHSTKHRRGCNTFKCDHKADAMWAKKHKPRWVIPSYIVMCESKGKNLPPNSASAAGYYQIIASTWESYGGGNPSDASQHSKAEQDRVAARIANTSPRGLGEWDCA